jgi:DNA replication and repair protein RecF
MLVERLTLRQFRNYDDLTVEFAPGGAYITGANGSGKTNLLEAIYYLANQVSFRTSRREELQGWGTRHGAAAAAAERIGGAAHRERATAPDQWQGDP